MLIVPIHCYVARTDCESGLGTLSIKPCKTLFLHDREAMAGPLTFRMGS